MPEWQPASFPQLGELNGQHCKLSPLEIGHCEAFFDAFSLATDDRDWTWLGAEKPACLQEMMLWIKNKINDSSLVAWAVTEMKSGTPGWCGLL